MIALYILRTYYAPMRSVSGPFFTLGAVALAYSPLGEQVWIRVQGDGMIAQGVGVAVARIWTLSALDDRCSCSCSRSACGMGKRR